jgi:hypothetical protein
MDPLVPEDDTQSAAPSDPPGLLKKQADPSHEKMLQSLRRYQSSHREQLKARKRERSAQPAYPEQAKALQGWWDSKGRSQYGSVAKFAREGGVWPGLMWSYIGGRVRPDGERRAKLYEITGLNCFAPDVPPEWVKDFESRARDYIDSLSAAFATKKRYKEFTRRIIADLVLAGITAPIEITAAELLKHSPGYKPDQTKRVALGFFGSLLVVMGAWARSQEDEFKSTLKQLYPHRVRRTVEKLETPTQPSAMNAFVVSLVINGGLGVQQIRNLRVTQIESHGLRVGPNQLLRFGDGWHQIPKSVVDQYWLRAIPQDFLFYSYRPPDYHRPASRASITRAMRNAQVGRAGSPVETAHFEEDARRLENPRRLRAHLRYFHNLTGRKTWLLMKKFYSHAAKTFVLPEPYILAVMCVSRLLRSAAEPQQGGRVFAYTWHGLLGGRYNVTVSWPLSLFRKLDDGRSKPGIARSLLKLGQGRWNDGRRGLTDKRGLRTFKRLWQKQKGPMSRKLYPWKSLVAGVDKTLLGQLEATQVEIHDGGKIWNGHVLNRTKGRILLPLIDELEGGRTNPRCPVCGHPDRDAIDAEIRSGQSTFAVIAKKYGLAYGPAQHQLLWHAGRITHNDLPSHLGSAPPARVVRCWVGSTAKGSAPNAPNLAALLLRLLNADRRTLELIEGPTPRKENGDPDQVF